MDMIDPLGDDDQEALPATDAEFPLGIDDQNWLSVPAAGTHWL